MQDIKQITDDWSKQAKELSECEDIKQIAKKEFLEPEIGVYWNTTAEESVDFWFKVISLAVEQEKERIVDLLPIEKMHTLADDVNSPHETEHDRGWNEYRRTLLTLINNK